MRPFVIGSAWVWFLVALPHLTDAGWNPFWFLLLAGSGLVIGLVWVGHSLSLPAVFRMRRTRWAWLSVPLVGVLSVALQYNLNGLRLRVWLSEPQLRAFAEEARQSERYDTRTIWVGLVEVTTVSTYDPSEVRLITTSGFLDRYGLAYRPDGPPPEWSWRYTHLFGPWYRLYDRF
jgi:hypothetical protein